MLKKKMLTSVSLTLEKLFPGLPSLAVAAEAGQQYACKYTYDDTHPLPVLV